ncbi:T9SS type A sorting domain-containing protein [Lewinella sp. LCG006]|uniref:T9SS type A sorting domain-containing protein n=1 Tax=Lewinella sp. LCG006 TaxID=3231911 RepID=UPI00346128CD
MKHVLLSIFALLFTYSISAATYRNFVSYEVINGGNTVRIWVDSDTAPGETTLAEIRWDNGIGGFNYSGLINGVFDTGDINPNANWYVDITIPTGVNNADSQLATKNQSGSNYGFTDFIYPLTALPVTLKIISVKAEETYINLSFTTATETNNAYFHIERSTDSRNWEKLGSIAGAGTTQEEQHYQFLDVAPAPGLNYYRIKQVDYDGSFSYSSIVSARWEGKINVQLYPNPTDELLQISGLPDDEGPITIEIIDMAGRIVLRQNWTQSAINVAQLADGVYSLRILSTAGVMDNQRLFIH